LNRRRSAREHPAHAVGQPLIAAAIGRVCTLALLYQYMLVLLTLWPGFVAGHPIPKPPTLDDSLWQLMFGMLGMGALRSFE
jgi:hypothetical protein